MLSYFKINPPADLGQKIIDRLKLEEAKNLRRRLIIDCFLFIVSAIILLLLLRLLALTFTKSAIGIFLNLLFTDAAIFFKYWQNFILAILEALPVIEIIVFLGVLWLFLKSLQIFIRTIKDYKNSKTYLFKVKYS